MPGEGITRSRPPPVTAARLAAACATLRAMPEEPRRTVGIKLRAAMPVRTVAAVVAEGPDAGASWEGEQGTIGTAKDCDLVLGDATVSGYHLRVSASKQGIVVADIGSTNGTFYGDARIERAVIPAGSVLRLGHSAVRL